MKPSSSPSESSNGSTRVTVRRGLLVLLPQQLGELGNALVFRDALEQRGIDVELRAAVFGGQHRDPVRLRQPRTIAERFAGRQEDERQDDADMTSYCQLPRLKSQRINRLSIDQL